jgi:RNA polymerase sigma-70 factor
MPGIEQAVLSSYLQEAWLKGRSVHGDLGLDRISFESRVGQVIEKHTLPTRLPIEDTHGRGLHVPDLYLTAACAQRTEPAWSRFGDLYRHRIQGLCQWIWRDISASADAAQDVFIDLYMPDRNGECRIGSYDGMSSLTRWLRTIVMNRWLNHRKRGAGKSRSLDIVPDPVDTSAFGRIETMFAVRRYEPLAALALSHACECLTIDERLVMLWRFEQNLRLGEIARLLGVHQSTVTRQMDRAMARVRVEMVRQLTDRYGLSENAVRDCLETLANNMPETLSVLALLTRKGGTAADAAGWGYGTVIDKAEPNSAP